MVVKGRSKDHPIVEQIVPDPNLGPIARPMLGYPGKSTLANYTRLYLNRYLTEYSDIPNDCIIYQEDQAQETGGPSILWVKHETVLQTGRFNFKSEFRSRRRRGSGSSSRYRRFSNRSRSRFL